MASACGIIFYITNYFGMKSAAKAQKVMNCILFLAYAAFIVFGIINMDTTFVFNKEVFLTNGMSGFFSAVALLVFCMGGGMAMLELGGAVEDAEPESAQGLLPDHAVRRTALPASRLQPRGLCPWSAWKMAAPP